MRRRQKAAKLKISYILLFISYLEVRLRSSAGVTMCLGHVRGYQLKHIATFHCKSLKACAFF